MANLEIIIPFSGFYYSIHDDAINSEIERIFSDYETGCDVNNGLVDRAHMDGNFRHFFVEYAKAYVEAFADEFEIPSLKFKELDSPREYNFTTDKIVCEIDIRDVRRIMADIDKKELENRVKERFTSYDGFISFYSNDVNDWPSEVSDWDCNQLRTLLEVYAGATNEFDQWAEFNLMDDCSGNGYVTQWLEESIPSIERLYKIHDYLQERESRK